MDICGSCGHDKADPITVACNNCGEDFWVQSEDFAKPELNDYITVACINLDVTRKQLWEKLTQDEYDVTITAKVTKTVRVAADCQDDAIFAAFEVFDVKSDGLPERYSEEWDEVKKV